MCPFYRWRYRPTESHKLSSGQAPGCRSEALAGKQVKGRNWFMAQRLRPDTKSPWRWGLQAAVVVTGVASTPSEGAHITGMDACVRPAEGSTVL